MLNPEQQGERIAEASDYLQHAVLNVKAQRFGQAIQNLKHLIEHDQHSEVALGMLGSLYAMLGMKERAMGQYAQVLAINPDNQLARLQLAMLDTMHLPLAEAGWRMAELAKEHAGSSSSDTWAFGVTPD